MAKNQTKQTEVTANVAPLDAEATKVVYAAFVAEANAEDAIKVAAEHLLNNGVLPQHFRLNKDGTRPDGFNAAMFAYVNELAIKARFGDRGILLYNKAESLRTDDDKKQRAGIVKWMNGRREKLASTMQSALDEQKDKGGAGETRVRMLLSEAIDQLLSDAMEKVAAFNKSKRDLNTADVIVCLRDCRAAIRDLSKK